MHMALPASVRAVEQNQRRDARRPQPIDESDDLVGRRGERVVDDGRIKSCPFRNKLLEAQRGKVGTRRAHRTIVRCVSASGACPSTYTGIRSYRMSRFTCAGWKVTSMLVSSLGCR